MAVLQELASDQIDELIAQAGTRNIPMVITINSHNTWYNLKSRALWRRTSSRPQNVSG